MAKVEKKKERTPNKPASPSTLLKYTKKNEALVREVTDAIEELKCLTERNQQHLDRICRLKEMHLHIARIERFSEYFAEEVKLLLVALEKHNKTNNVITQEEP